MSQRIGQQLGTYRLLRVLGEGGFATVYLGEHVHLGTLAALKLLHLSFSPEDSEAFRKEAQLIARLEHPHIVRVLDYDVQAGTPFLVMSFAPGGTLRTVHPSAAFVKYSNKTD
jgi:serine/threonine protein kinase